MIRIRAILILEIMNLLIGIEIDEFYVYFIRFSITQCDIPKTNPLIINKNL